jgi:putative spermidine/putrescine transport system permease protein
LSVAALGALRRLRHSRQLSAAMGIGPFAAFAVLFLILPTAGLFAGAFQDAEGHFTLANIGRLLTPVVASAFKASLMVSGASALIGAVFGLAVAMALQGPGLPAPVRAAMLTLSGVASNFAGVPLAFAFLATVGRLGLVTILLRQFLGFDIYAAGFNLLDITGLTLTYVYFQLPLMVLLIMPAVEGLRREWREASSMLGATLWQHAWRITLPILFPSVAGAALLLFANAFGAVATAYALTGSFINLVTILLYAEIRGEVLHDPNLGFALAFGMVFITGVCNIIYLRLRAFTERRFR